MLELCAGEVAAGGFEAAHGIGWGGEDEIGVCICGLMSLGNDGTGWDECG